MILLFQPTKPGTIDVDYSEQLNITIFSSEGIITIGVVLLIIYAIRWLFRLKRKPFEIKMPNSKL